MRWLTICIIYTIGWLAATIFIVTLNAMYPDVARKVLLITFIMIAADRIRHGLSGIIEEVTERRD